MSKKGGQTFVFKAKRKNYEAEIAGRSGMLNPLLAFYEKKRRRSSEVNKVVGRGRREK